jgi:hypothetical protein
MATVLPNILAFARESLVFAKAETTFATEVKPTAADQVLMAGEGSVSQNRGFIADPQRRNTYSPLPDIAARYEPGSISFPMLIKPRTPGTAPDGGQLLKALFGRETIVASTSVKYHPLRTSDTRQSLTVWVKDGHFVYRCLGTVLTKGSFPIAAGNSEEALGRVALEGTFAELRWTGTDELAATLNTGATTFTAKSAKKFTIGSYVGFRAASGATNDNSGAGYQITAVNYGTNVCTFTPALAGTGLAADDLIYPWLPTGSENGVIVHGRLGDVTRGGVSLPLMSGEIVYEFPVKLMNEEKNGQNFATRFATAGIRSVTANVNVLFDANAGSWWYDVSQAVQADLICNWGTASGARYKLTAKNQLLSAPQVSGNEERIVALNGKAFASSSYDDELELLLD